MDCKCIYEEKIKIAAICLGESVCLRIAVFLFGGGEWFERKSALLNAKR